MRADLSLPMHRQEQSHHALGCFSHNKDQMNTISFRDRKRSIYTGASYFFPFTAGTEKEPTTWRLKPGVSMWELWLASGDPLFLPACLETVGLGVVLTTRSTARPQPQPLQQLASFSQAEGETDIPIRKTFWSFVVHDVERYWLGMIRFFKNVPFAVDSRSAHCGFLFFYFFK